MEPLLRAEKITKSFPGVLAVDEVDFSLHTGEILALVGENGAGKSTLVQVLGGVMKPDRGQIWVDGQPFAFQSSRDAMEAGISMVFQELSLVGGLSIAENIFANRQPTGRVDNIRWRDLHQQTYEFLDKFNLRLDPRMPVKRLSMGQQQILEILKAISTQPKVLILDEPTSSLTESEINYLFENIRKLREQGMSFIYITHKLSEVFQIADRVMVMRDGQYIGDRAVREVNENDLISMMVGRKIENLYGHTRETLSSEEYFCVENLSRKYRFENISFRLKRGEILGMAGLVGAGRTEVARAVFGADMKDSGRIILKGKVVHISRPEDAIRQGIVYLSEDRKGMGLFLNMTLRENLIAPSLGKFTSNYGFLNARKIDRFANQAVREYDIATPSIAKKMINLSGGNQQKCLIAMWMGIQPEVIIFDEPTRGVDVAARAEIYQKLREISQQGVGIIMISSDLPELIGMCDRILVMHQGKISGEVLRAEFSEERILSLAAGIKANGSPTHSFG